MKETKRLTSYIIDQENEVEQAIRIDTGFYPLQKTNCKEFQDLIPILTHSFSTLFVY